MNFPPQDAEAIEFLFERYLDGQLQGDELAWMRARIEQDPALRNEEELHRRMTESLRRIAAPEQVPFPAATASAPVDPPAPIPITRASGPQTLRLRRWGMAVAAALLLAGAGLFRVYWDSRVPDFNLMAPGELYSRLVMSGFHPAQVCTSDPEFAALVHEKLGTALIATASPDVEVLGWGYSSDYNGSPISPRTMMLLAKVDGREVLVLLDQTARDRTLAAPAGGKLNLFRREVGQIVAYELTPMAEARVIPGLVPYQGGS